MCFSLEEHKLLKGIGQENADCEIKRFRRTERNDVLITYYISIKKMKLDFMQRMHHTVFREISTMENEPPFFGMENVK